jgi:KUP system potassium uptake protein
MESTQRLTAATPDDETLDRAAQSEYRTRLGELMYLAIGTRPDIAYTVGQLSRFVSNPTKKHAGVLHRLSRYILGTLERGITYKRNTTGLEPIVRLAGASDSDWAGDLDTRHSTTGFTFNMQGGAVSWMSRRQSIIALSSAEAEYIAACEATMESQGLANVLRELIRKEPAVTIKIDNSAALSLATQPTFGQRTRHIELRCHYVREQVRLRRIQLVKVASAENPADALTKPLPAPRISYLCNALGMSMTD